MKCNVKGHRLDGNVFGDVYQVFRNAEREGKCPEPDETKRGLEERKKQMELIHANFAERESGQIKRQFEGCGKSERLIHSAVSADVIQIGTCRRLVEHTDKIDKAVFNG